MLNSHGALLASFAHQTKTLFPHPCNTHVPADLHTDRGKKLKRVGVGVGVKETENKGERRKPIKGQKQGKHHIDKESTTEEPEPVCCRFFRNQQKLRSTSHRPQGCFKKLLMPARFQQTEAVGTTYQQPLSFKAQSDS